MASFLKPPQKSWKNKHVLRPFGIKKIATAGTAISTVKTPAPKFSICLIVK
jgi:hypothetical protein